MKQTIFDALTVGTVLWLAILTYSQRSVIETLHTQTEILAGEEAQIVYLLSKPPAQPAHRTPKKRTPGTVDPFLDPPKQLEEVKPPSPPIPPKPLDPDQNPEPMCQVWGGVLVVCPGAQSLI